MGRRMVENLNDLFGWMSWIRTLGESSRDNWLTIDQAIVQKKNVDWKGLVIPEAYFTPTQLLQLSNILLEPLVVIGF